MKARQRLLVGVSVLAATALTLGTIGWVRFERSVDARMDRLQASGRLPEAPAELTPTEEQLLSDFDELTRGLERAMGERQPRHAAYLSRAWWEPETSEELERRVSAVAPVLARLDAFVASDPVRAHLHGEGRAPWRGRRPGPPALSSLLWIGHWTNALAARAVVAARRGDEESTCASLANALTLLQLVDGGSVTEFYLASSMRQDVFACVRFITDESPPSAVAFRRELDPLLANGPSSASVKRSFTTEVTYFLDRGEDRIRDLGYSWPWSWYWYVREATSALDTFERASFEPTDRRWPRRPDRSTIFGFDTLDVHLTNRLGLEQRHTTFCRVHLALEAHRQRTGAWPERLDELAPMLGDAPLADPVTGEPLHYEVGPDRVTLAFAHVARSDYDGPDYCRTAWTWQRASDDDG